MQPFFDELADLFSVLMTSSNQVIVVCGALNCHGDDPNSIDDRLAAVFDAMNMKQYVDCPTRENRLLDVLACSDDQLIRDVTVDDAGNVSDHRLITAWFQANRKRWPPVTYSFRRLSKMDFKVFEESVLSSPLFTAPENTVDSFVDKFRMVVGSTLDKVAPLQTVKCTSSGKHINRFLSEDAIRAKQKRRRLERVWKKTGVESDRLAYRRQCKAANKTINESRRKHYAQRIADVNAQKIVGLLLMIFYIPRIDLLRRRQKSQNHNVMLYRHFSTVKSAA